MRIMDSATCIRQVVPYRTPTLRWGCSAPMDGDHPSFDTPIEVLDARTGELIASRRFSAFLGEFLPRQQIAIPEIEPDGDQAFRIVQLALEER